MRTTGRSQEAKTVAESEGRSESELKARKELALGDRKVEGRSEVRRTKEETKVGRRRGTCRTGEIANQAKALHCETGDETGEDTEIFAKAKYLRPQRNEGCALPLS